jgi:hypothetical protein
MAKSVGRQSAVEYVSETNTALTAFAALINTTEYSAIRRFAMGKVVE